MKCSDAALIFWTHAALMEAVKMWVLHAETRTCGYTERKIFAHVPLVQGLGFESVDAIDVRDVEQRLVAGWVGWHFHQYLVQEERLAEMKCISANAKRT